MATFHIGKLGLKTEPMYRLKDWKKAREVEWKSLQMGLNEVTVWDCTKQAFSPKPPAKVPVPVVLTTSSVNPLGRVDPVVKQKRYDRFVAASGLGSRAKFGSAFTRAFGTPTIPFPERDVQRKLDKRYRHVICYERFDRHILLTRQDEGRLGDYLILCFPARIIWWAVQVGICGTEKRVVIPEDSLFEDGSVYNRIEYRFQTKGPYKKLPEPRMEIIDLSTTVPSAMGRFEYEFPSSLQTPLWRRFLRDDAAAKIKAAKAAGFTTGPGSPYATKFSPNFSLLRARRDAELKRLHDKYG
ncbi:MAG: hypothetical protein AAFZ02_13320 [Pseudomonadota bacterium]